MRALIPRLKPGENENLDFASGPLFVDELSLVLQRNRLYEIQSDLHAFTLTVFPVRAAS